MTFRLMCVLIIFSSVWFAEWPPFGKEFLTRLTICSLCIVTICNFSYFPFCFEGWNWVLIASVPGITYFLQTYINIKNEIRTKAISLLSSSNHMEKC